jgi:hypothetical protein
LGTEGEEVQAKGILSNVWRGEVSRVGRWKGDSIMKPTKYFLKKGSGLGMGLRICNRWSELVQSKLYASMELSQ